MKTLQGDQIPFTAVGLIQTAGRKCEYCDAEIPTWRNRKAQYCSDSCKEMAFRRRKKDPVAKDIFVETIAPQLGAAEIIPIPAPDSSPPTIVESTGLADDQPPLIVPTPSASPQSPPDHWKMATTSERQIVRNMCRMTAEIEECIGRYLKSHKSAIPVNEIHALLPASMALNKLEKIELADYSLRLSLDRATYLLCKTK